MYGFFQFNGTVSIDVALKLEPRVRVPLEGIATGGGTGMPVWKEAACPLGSSAAA